MKKPNIPDSCESRGFLLTSAFNSAIDVIGPIESVSSLLILLPLSVGVNFDSEMKK